MRKLIATTLLGLSLLAATPNPASAQVTQSSCEASLTMAWRKSPANLGKDAEEWATQWGKILDYCHGFPERS